MSPAQHPALHGRRVLVTRPAEQAGRFITALRDYGADVVVCPTIRVVPPDDFTLLDAAIERLGTYDWLILTSVNGVKFFCERLERTVDDLHRAHPKLQVGAIGPATAEALAQRNIQTRFIPEEYVAEAIVEQIGDVSGLHILLPHANIARKTLVEGLLMKGALVDEIVAYRTLPVAANDAASISQIPQVDIATFTSPSTVHQFVMLCGARTPQYVLGDALIACIGPITARAVIDHGLDAHIVAAEHTSEGLIHAILAYLELPA